MSNKEHNRIGFRNRIEKRRLKAIKYSGDYDGNTPTHVFTSAPNPASCVTPPIKFKTKLNRHINNQNDKLIGKVFTLTTE
jgi:hypothetical protein